MKSNIIVRVLKVVGVVYLITGLNFLIPKTAMADETVDIHIRYESLKTEEEEIPSGLNVYVNCIPDTYKVKDESIGEWQEIIVDILNADKNKTYTLGIASALYVLPDGSLNPSEFTTDKYGDATFKFRLYKGQEFSIKGLPAGAGYVVKEDYLKLGLNSEGELRKGIKSEEGYWEWSVKSIPGYEDDRKGILNNSDVFISFFDEGIYRYPTKKHIHRLFKIWETKFCLIVSSPLILVVFLMLFGKGVNAFKRKEVGEEVVGKEDEGQENNENKGC